MRSLIAAFFSRGIVVLIFWLITILVCVQTMYKSSFTVGASALVACALCYAGAAGFMGSLIARREKKYRAFERALASNKPGLVVLVCRIVSLRALAAFIATHLGAELVERHGAEHRDPLAEHPERHPDRSLAALASDPRITCCGLMPVTAWQTS